MPSNRIRPPRRYLEWSPILVACATLMTIGCASRGFNARPASAAPTKKAIGKDLDAKSSHALLTADPELISKTLTEADTKHSGAAVCEDWRLAIHLVAQVHPAAGKVGTALPAARYRELLDSCPATYSEAARGLRALQISLKDFHTSFEAPDLDHWVVPTIVKCHSTAVCGEGGWIEGGPLAPVFSDIGRKAYAVTAIGTFLSVLSVDGKDVSRIFDDLVATESISRQKGANAGGLSRYLFLKHILEPLPSATQRLRVKRLDNGEIGQIDISFRHAPTGVPVLSPQARAAISAHEQNRHYACGDVTPGSTELTGSCLLDKTRGLVWLSSFGDVRSIDVLGSVRKLLGRNPALKSAGNPLILDLRGNGGGSPELAAELACMLGGKDVAARIADRRLVASGWPASFEVAPGKSIATSSFPEGGNDDLRWVTEDWKVGIKDPGERPEPRRIEFFERMADGGTLSSPARCEGLHTPEFAGLRWTILTSGKEFSATENFLSFVAPLDARFTILGRVSMGGTGAPTVVTLPATGMKLRISQARHQDAKTGEWHIEGVGVRPDVSAEADSAASFERYLIASSKGTLDPADPSFRPLVLRKALGM